MTIQHTSGVWGRSSQSGYEEYVIFCVGRDLRRVSAFRAWASANRIGFKSLVGCYRGMMEHSFIVNAKDYPRVYAWTAREESVLWISRANARDYRTAKLIFKDGHVEDIGTMVACQRDTAIGRDSWTFDPATGEYFICI